MLNIDDQPVPAEETTAPVSAPKARKARKAAEAAGDNGKAPKAPKAPKAAKAAPKAAARAVKVIKKVAKPRHRDPAKLDEFGYRKGSVRSKAAHIYAGRKGATLTEVKDKVGSLQYNLLKEVERRGHKVRKVPEKTRGGRNVTRYFLTAA
jgi:hypothetical protein